MMEVITTAGLDAVIGPQPDSKREALRKVRAVLRNPQATDDDYDDALDALTELSKE
jgi:hypothetical protein